MKPNELPSIRNTIVGLLAILLCFVFVESARAVAPIPATDSSQLYHSGVDWVSVIPVDTPQATATFGPQSSTFAADNGFDFAETFDGLDNWRPNNGAEGAVGEEGGDNLKMPRINGGDSAWGFYTIWGDGRTPPQDWVGDYGDNRVWRGTKAATIDIGESAAGPSRLGLYMGEGYEDFHLFFMVNIPKNVWPTSCPYEEDGVTPTPDGTCNASAQGTYTEGENYKWYSSWKFNTFNLDCPSAICPDRSTYSDKWNMLVSMKTRSYDTVYIGQRLMFEGRDLDNVWGETPEELTFNSYLGDWFGIEYHVTIVGNVATFSSWTYDQQGNAVLNTDGLTWTIPAEAVGTKWNQFLFGGNNSDTYSWGPTMQSEYYIDDFIIDADRIGPKYFAAIAAETVPPTQAETPLSLPSSWYVYGDSQTSGRATETNAASPPQAFERIWVDSGFSSPTLSSDGVSGATLGDAQTRYNNDTPHTNPSWLHFQDSGSQKTDTATQTLFGDTLDTFVNTAFAELTNNASVITTETAFSFGREAESGRNWDGYNQELRDRLAIQAAAGKTVYIAEVDAHIKALQTQLTPTDVWFQDGESNAYHYKGLGNLMVALSMYEALGYDVDTLDLSGIPEGGTITNSRKQLCLDIIKERI